MFTWDGTKTATPPRLDPSSRLSRWLLGDRMVLIEVVDTRKMMQVEVEQATIGPMRERQAKELAEHLVDHPSHFDDHWIVSVRVGRIAPRGHQCEGGHA
jgi:hypothetical protein